MEIVTIVNEKNKLLGYIPRELSKNYLVRVAAIIVFRSNGNILLSKVSKNKKTDPLKWSYSAAGHIEKESIEVAAIRETEEELGIKAKLQSFIGISNIKGKSFHYVFKVVYDGDVNFDKSEIEEVKEFTRDELSSLIKTTPEIFRQNLLIILNKIGF